MASAYVFADGGRISPEMRMLYAIRDFGVHAVMGRPVLAYSEIMRMRAANYVKTAYEERAKSKNWQADAEKDPLKAQILFNSQKAARDILDWE